MASSLSAYWANFFKGAGFTTEVAMRHALVFSNNRIKPDMLSDLDKPSLKEMGITLMGDMIAILRYAKKVVEERSCEKFLMDSEQTNEAPKKTIKVVPKKVLAKPVPKAPPSTLKADSTTTKKPIQASVVSKVKKVLAKKPMPAKSGTTIEAVPKLKKPVLKRKTEEDDDLMGNDDDIEPISTKKLKSVHTEDDAGYNVVFPKVVTLKSQQILRKYQDQKQTVFDRLGEECIETTANAGESAPTFNITGLGKDIFKRSPSVFNRLGDKDVCKSERLPTKLIQNGTKEKSNLGILKSQSASARTCLVSAKGNNTRSGGTMRADHEQSKKPRTNLVVANKKSITKIQYNSSPAKEKKYSQNSILSSKLASEQPTSIPAKARLGVVKTGPVSKQVTFSNTTTITHYNKPNVFSRLG